MISSSPYYMFGWPGKPRNPSDEEIIQWLDEKIAEHIRARPSRKIAGILLEQELLSALDNFASRTGQHIGRAWIRTDLYNRRNTSRRGNSIEVELEG